MNEKTKPSLLDHELTDVELLAAFMQQHPHVNEETIINTVESCPGVPLQVVLGYLAWRDVARAQEGSYLPLEKPHVQEMIWMRGGSRDERKRRSIMGVPKRDVM